MIHLDRKHLDDKCEELIADIEEKKLRSTAWVWIALGGMLGFAASCIRLKHKTVEPVMAASKEEKEKEHGFTNGIGDSPNNPRFRSKKDK